MGREFHVSPRGDDDGPGTEAEPFATLERARDAARETAGRETVTVYLRDGVHRLEDTFVLTPRDGGTEDHPVKYVAAPGEDPVVSGGLGIDDWRPLEEPIPGLPDRAREHVWVADLPRVGGEPWTFSVLFDGEGLLTRAHTPPRTHRERDDDESDRALHRELHADPDDVGWTNVDHAELFLTPHYPWTVNYLPVAAVDEEEGVVETSLPSTYPMDKPWGWGDEDGFYQVENVFEGLDGPGRWVLDADAERVYLWPRNDGGAAGDAEDAGPENVVAPRLIEQVRVGSGDDRPTEHIAFEGITFAHSDRMRWRPERTSLQHDWEQHDEPNAILRLRGAENVEVADCRFVDSGSGGIRLDRHAVDCRIEHCEVAHVGGPGVVLDGYGPGSRDENHHNHIVGNHVHHAGRLWWHSAGVFVAQSGHNAIRDNHIHDLPYTGVVVSGLRTGVFESEDAVHEGHRTVRSAELRDTPFEPPHFLGLKHARYNQIEHNEVHDVMQELGDGNGIYLSGTGEGNVVRRNHVHDISGAGTQSAIRMDDGQYHTLTTENVVNRINGAGIVGKHVNQIHNNVVIGCYNTEGPDQAHVSVRHRGPSHGTGIRRNVVVQPDREDRLPLVELTDLFRQSLVDDNLYHSRADPDEAAETLRRLREGAQGTRSVAADPEFVAPDDDDFRVPADSPACDVGFRPFETWGPTVDAGPER